MTTWKAHVVTGVLTLAAGSIALALWWGVERQRSPRLGRVDIGQIVAKQQKSLVERVKPGIDAHEQGRIFEDAKAFGNRLDAALEQASRECGCALMNSAALLKAAHAGIPDLTERVEALASSPAPASPASSGR
jgi:hypothetical protein